MADTAGVATTTTTTTTLISVVGWVSALAPWLLLHMQQEQPRHRGLSLWACLK